MVVQAQERFSEAAIEPMATLGKDAVYTDVDGWTVRTKDGSSAAHFEHTVLVTDNGYEILTTSLATNIK
jgi:methionyl aminopeptidase